jgi:hypothetical protein
VNIALAVLVVAIMRKALGLCLVIRQLLTKGRRFLAQRGARPR